jgi:hypothetical protein
VVRVEFNIYHAEGSAASITFGRGQAKGISSRVEFRLPGGSVIGDMHVDADDLRRMIQIFGKIRAIMVAVHKLPTRLAWRYRLADGGN